MSFYVIFLKENKNKNKTMFSLCLQNIFVFSGLFHQVIAQSGSELAVWAINGPGQRPEHYTQDVSSYTALSKSRARRTYRKIFNIRRTK